MEADSTTAAGSPQTSDNDVARGNLSDVARGKTDAPSLRPSETAAAHTPPILRNGRLQSLEDEEPLFGENGRMIAGDFARLVDVWGYEHAFAGMVAMGGYGRQTRARRRRSSR